MNLEDSIFLTLVSLIIVSDDFPEMIPKSTNPENVWEKRNLLYSLENLNLSSITLDNISSSLVSSPYPLMMERKEGFAEVVLDFLVGFDWSRNHSRLPKDYESCSVLSPCGQSAPFQKGPFPRVPAEKHGSYTLQQHNREHQNIPTFDFELTD